MGIQTAIDGRISRDGRVRGKFLHRFANPGQFMRASGKFLPWLAASGLIVTATGLAWGLFFAPADWQATVTPSESCMSTSRYARGWHRPAIWGWRCAHSSLSSGDIRSRTWRLLRLVR